MGEYLIGIDIGTSACKVTVFNVGGEVIFSTAKTYDIYYPHTGWAEQDAREWWAAVCSALKEVFSSGKVKADEIAGIGVDGQSWAALPISSEGEVLRRVMIWFDRRAQSQAQQIAERVGLERVISLSGNPVDPAYITPKMLWIKENEPEIYKRTYKFLQSNGYIVYKLTGQFTQDLSQGYGFHFFNVKKGCYDKDICREMGLDIDKVADIYPCHQIVGCVSRWASVETGLKEGTPVVAGGLDAAASTLGAGVIEEGQTQEQGGQAGGMSICMSRPVIEPRLILGYHVVPDRWLLQGGTVGGGGALKWFKEQLGYEDTVVAQKKGISPYKVIDDKVKDVPPGSDGLVFLPYMSGERSPIWNSKARGVFFGLSYDKTRAHMARAVMEGCAFALKHNIDVAEEAKAVVDKLISVGGAANSAVWTQIKADITKKDILVPYSDDATALGAAILAGVGTGVYGDFKEAVEKTVRLKNSYHPNPENFPIYEGLYGIYRELYINLEKTYDRLADILADNS
ncbi:xylulokinase [Caldanaerobius fijiensis DSM 17918]|uniref:Xylulokinase n=1 Tax=Caldanaerobius fijiensis DSM 17918 TaxID=1121256 RepID=A0A1M5DBB5_9THEO|nr:FGGY-family carbohydrate kinase [Caldanaerobius fijiensis]SHF64215.1 xylulokinase [Caldanaerobius fijiensis DSM 17918]